MEDGFVININYSINIYMSVHNKEIQTNLSLAQFYKSMDLVSDSN